MPKLPFAGRLAACILASTALCGAAAARDVASGPLKITRLWSPPAPPSAPTAAGYLTIANAGPAPDRLIGASSPDFNGVQIHLMSMADGIMSMRPVPRGLVVPAGGSVTLAPDGFHLMLTGPRRAFKAGEHIPVVLTFEHAGSVRAELDVQASAAAAMPGMVMH
jgi:copper(I)-binding protein